MSNTPATAEAFDSLTQAVCCRNHTDTHLGCCLRVGTASVRGWSFQRQGVPTARPGACETAGVSDKKFVASSEVCMVVM